MRLVGMEIFDGKMILSRASDTEMSQLSLDHNDISVIKSC